jgi:hypothetical protein
MKIAEVESQKIVDEQVLVLNQDQDIIMIEQDTTHQASDKGKNVVVDITPPTSPVRTLRELGTPSSAIPPPIQVVLDGMQAQIAELKADSKVKDQKMDQMLFFLKDLHDRLPPKP